MAPKNNVRMYAGIVGLLLMGLVTYWMYIDSAKSAKIAEEKMKQALVAPAPNPVKPGVSKLSGIFKDFLDNPYQGRGVQKPVVHVIDGNGPSTCVTREDKIAPSQAIPPQNRESFYKDEK